MNTTATTASGHHVGCDCGTCAVTHFERNNYFTGKLLLERDFTDEQEYVLAKLRHHNQRLHGSGVVCGLRMVQHPNRDCRTRFVRLTPGTAVDCCGNDVLVTDEEDVELASLAAVAGIAPNDEALHELAICVRYHECGNEPVPVLYDECGCDDDRCLPNRILESHLVDAVLDPPVSTAWTGPTLKHLRDVAVPDAHLVAALPDGAFAVAGETEVHRVDPTGAVVATKDLTTTIHGLDVAPGGSLYATRDDGSGKVVVTVLDAGTLAETHEKKIASSAVPAATAVLADGRLAVLQQSIGSLAVLEAALETGSTAAAKKVAVDKERGLLVAHPTRAVAYVAAGPGSADLHPERLDAVDVDAGTVAAAASLTDGTQVQTLAAVGEGTRAFVLVALADEEVVVLEDDGTVAGHAGLTATAVDLAGGQWTWAVSSTSGTAGGQGGVQPVGVSQLVGSGAGAVGPVTPLPGAGRSVAVSADGRTVYVAYGGGVDGQPEGGVAVLDVVGKDCRADWEQLTDCPSCEHGDCVVVGTIHGYRPGFEVLDMPAPGAAPPDPAADAAAGIARIDNHAGRQRLRSTAALERAIECLLDSGTGGGAGRDGRDGRDGVDGRDGIDGVDGRNGTDGTDGRDGVNGTNGTDGRDGRDGEGLEVDLTRIVMLSWEHTKEHLLAIRQISDPQGERHDGLVLVFSRPVDVTLIDAAHVFTVEAPDPFDRKAALEFGMRCRCPVAGDVFPVKVTGVTNGIVDSADITPGVQFSEAVAFVFKDSITSLVRVIEELYRQLEEEPTFVVRLHGEFVLDEEGRAVDAEFTRAELPTGDHPSGSKFGVQGGLFQSWFNVRNG